MKQNEHKRVKRGKTPGDHPISVTARMQERMEEFVTWSGQTIQLGAVRAFRRLMKTRSHSVQRQRDKRVIDEGMGDDEQ